MTNEDDKRIYNPSSKKYFWKMLYSEYMQRKFNKSPIWMIRRRNRILKKWWGDKRNAVFSVFAVLCRLW